MENSASYNGTQCFFDSLFILKTVDLRFLSGGGDPRRRRRELRVSSFRREGENRPAIQKSFLSFFDVVSPGTREGEDEKGEKRQGVERGPSALDKKPFLRKKISRFSSQTRLLSRSPEVEENAVACCRPLVVATGKRTLDWIENEQRTTRTTNERGEQTSTDNNSKKRRGGRRRTTETGRRV